MGQTLRVVPALTAADVAVRPGNAAAVAVSAASRFLASSAIQISAAGLRNIKKETPESDHDPATTGTAICLKTFAMPPR